MRNNENTEFGNELHIYYGVHELKKNIIQKLIVIITISWFLYVPKCTF